VDPGTPSSTVAFSTQSQQGPTVEVELPVMTKDQPRFSEMGGNYGQRPQEPVELSSHRNSRPEKSYWEKKPLPSPI
jgi:hypothetical protein